MPAGTGRDAHGNIDPVTAARDRALKWARQGERRYHIESVILMAQKYERIAVNSIGWDADPFLLGVVNGVVDLRTGTLREGRRDDCITKHAGVAFHPTASCPRWEQFLNEVLSDDSELVTFVRRALGYTLTGDVREDCWFGCYGEGTTESRPCSKRFT
jgi:putative DNA primase/helicase